MVFLAGPTSGTDGNGLPVLTEGVVHNYRDKILPVGFSDIVF
jgi:hypothetical protein